MFSQKRKTTTCLKKYQEYDENNKVIFKNIIGAFLIKGGALVVSLFTLPAFMRYFEDQQILGVWFTILSVITWILNFDLGIGNGLRNKLVTAIAKEDTIACKHYISSAYLMIGAIVTIIIVVGFIITPFINWNLFFNVSDQLISRDVMLRVTRCIFIGIMIQFLLRLISSILYALQKSAVNNLLALITSVLQLVFVLLMPSFTPEKNIIMLSYAYIFFTNIPLLIVTFVVFSTNLKSCFPKISYFKKEYATSVLMLGGIFFWCQIMYMIISNTNEFFITQYTDPKFVVEYQIYNKLFSLVGMLFSLALTPIWSSVTKAIAENNFNWLNKLYKMLKKIALIGIVLEILIIPFLQIIINLWLGDNTIEINYLYASLFALFGATFIYQSVLSTIVCGIGKMKLQSFCYTIGVVLKFIIIYFGIQMFNSWIVVVLANTIILIPYCILQQISLNKYMKCNLIER